MHITLHNPKSKVLPSLPFFNLPKFEAWSRLPFAQALIAAPKVMIFDEFPRSWKKARHSSHLRRWRRWAALGALLDHGIHGFRLRFQEQPWRSMEYMHHDTTYVSAIQKKVVRWMLPLSWNLLVNSTTSGSPETDLRRSYLPAIVVRGRYGNYNFTHKWV